MIVTSQEYLAAILAMSRQDRLSGTLTKTDGTTLPLSDSNLEVGSVSVSWECVTGEEIEFGSAIMAQLDLALRTQESRYAFYGAILELSYGVLLTDGTWFDVPLGVFTVAEAERKSSVVQLTAFDNLLILDEDYGGTALLGTPYEIFVQICEHCGLVLATTEEEFLAMPNGDQIIQVDGQCGCATWRDCAKVVAQMVGGFVIADRAGAIAIRRYGKESCKTIPRRNRYQTTMADYICNYMALRVVSSKGEFRAYDENQESGLELTIDDAPAWDYGMEDTLQARVDALLGELVQIVYNPGSCSLVGDPALECGDRLTLETEDGTVDTLITALTWKYHGKMTVKSAGVNPYVRNKVTRKTVSVRELQAQTTENKLTFYAFTNHNAVTVTGPEPKEISQVTFVTTEATSAMFLAQLPLTIEAADTTITESEERTSDVAVTDSTGATAEILDAEGNPLTLRVVTTDTTKTITHGFVDVQVEYYLDGNLVDYELVQRLPAGRHILALFYAFAALDGQANYQWVVKLSVIGGSGRAIVPKKAFRATVTGQGMAGTEAWDGTIDAYETIPAMGIVQRMGFAAFAESVTVGTAEPVPVTYSERIPSIRIVQRMGFAGFVETVDARNVVLNETIEADFTAWTYDNRYVVEQDGMVQLRRVYEYDSAEQAIDVGTMASVAVPSSDKVSVESVVVTDA